MLKFGLLCFVAAASIAVVSASCSHNTVNVKNSDDLLDALQNAKAGDDIILAPGTYKGDSFTVDSKGKKDCPITISCDEPESATINGMLKIDGVSYVTVSNIAIKGNGDYSAYCNNAENIVFENVHIFNSDNVGLYIQGSSSCTVDKCTFDKMGPYGILLSGSDKTTIHSCVFGDGISYNAIFLTSSSKNNAILSNSFYGNGYTKARPSWVSIDDNCAKNEVSYNTFINPNEHPMAGGVSCSSGASSNVFKENFMVLTKNAYGFLIEKPSDQKVCASNKVFGAPLTNTASNVDSSC